MVVSNAASSNVPRLEDPYIRDHEISVMFTVLYGNHRETYITCILASVNALFRYNECGRDG